MRIAVMGSGGLGSLFGGVLARAGADVTLVARGANLAALRERGLEVALLSGERFQVDVRATDDPAEVGPVDAVLFCVKTYDIEAAARSILPTIGPETLVLPVQNGVEAAEQIGAIVGHDRVVQGVGVAAATLERPGLVVQKGLTLRTLFGPDRVTGGKRAEAIAAAFRAAGIDAEVSPEVDRELWEKFIFALVGLGFMTLTRLPIGRTLACPESAEVAREVMNEGIAVGRARGVALGDTASDRAYARLHEIRDINPQAQGSMYFDLIAGKRLELEAINGAVVRMGRAAGIPTPLNGLIYGALKPYADGTSGPAGS